MTGAAAPARERRNAPGVVHQGSPDPVALTVEEEFPGWHVWRSQAGRWWATRTGRDARFGRGYDPRPMTVDADDRDGLRTVLAGYQDALR